MQTITGAQFLSAFTEEWQARVHESWKEMSEIYSIPRSWTKFMLCEGGVLESVAYRLQAITSPLRYIKENYSLDAVFAGGRDLFQDGLRYPSVLHVLIEHENNGDYDLETEMWKLIFWRSTLKVLICYDHNEDRKSTQRQKEWLDRSLESLRRMLAHSNADSSYPDNSEYLFIVGNRKFENGAICWRWASDKEHQLVHFIDEK